MFAIFQITREEALYIFTSPFPPALSFQNIDISIPSSPSHVKKLTKTYEYIFFYVFPLKFLTLNF